MSARPAQDRRFLPRFSWTRSGLRRRALRLEGSGRIREAIDAWTALNRLQPDAAIETHLVDLRCDPNFAAAEIAAAAKAPTHPWPRVLADPFPDVTDRPPEINADQLSMELLGGAILHHGCLLVRGLLSPDQVDGLRETIDRSFEGHARTANGAPPDETTPWYAPCPQWDASEPNEASAFRNYNYSCKAVHAADSPRGLFQIIDALTSTNVVPVINEYLGEQALLSIRKTMLRRVPPDATPSFHQDGTFMGLSTRAVDIWVALSECGEGTAAPGLAVLPRRLNAAARPNGIAPTMPLNATELAAVAEGSRVVSPTCRPGDALLFDELCLHANGGGRPGLERDRYALEAWFFAPSAMPDAYLPIVV